MLLGRRGLETARIPHADCNGLVWLDRGRLEVRDGCLRFVTGGGVLEAGTTTSGPTRPWAIWRPHKRAGRLSNPRAPRPACLRHQGRPDTQNSPADSRYDWGTNGGRSDPPKDIVFHEENLLVRRHLSDDPH